MRSNVSPLRPSGPLLPHEALGDFRDVLRRLHLSATPDAVRMLRAAGVRQDASVEVATDRLRELVGDGWQVWMHVSNMSLRTKGLVGAWRRRTDAAATSKPARRAGSTYERKVVEREVTTDGADEDDPSCSACEHPESEHPDDGACTHDDCDCEGFEAEEAEGGDEKPEKKPPPAEATSAHYDRMASRSSASASTLRQTERGLVAAGVLPPRQRAIAESKRSEQLDASEAALVKAGVLPPRGRK